MLRADCKNLNIFSKFNIIKDVEIDQSSELYQTIVAAIMEAIFHEKVLELRNVNLSIIINLSICQQYGQLCAQHCLNNLLQGEFFSAPDLADLAKELDTMERLRMAERGEDTPEYRQFMQVDL